MNNVDDYLNWISQELDQEVNFTRFQHIVVGGMFLKPVEQEEEEEMHPSVVLNDTPFMMTFREDSESYKDALNEIIDPIKSQSNVFRLSLESDSPLAIYDFMDIVTMDLRYPISFDLVMSETAQQELFSALLGDIYHENIQVNYNGNIFLAAINIDKSEVPLVSLNNHGQVCREFLRRTYSDSSVFKVESVAPTPHHQDVIFIEYEVIGGDASNIGQLREYPLDSKYSILFVPKAIGCEMAQLRFFMGISDSMLAFYSTQLLETNTYKKWSLVINSYSFIQPTIATVRSAKFPRIFTTIRSRSRLRDSIIQLLLDITDYEMYKLASKKRVESVLLSHSEGEYSEGSFLYEIWDTYKQRELGDSGTFLRLLEFLEYELQSIEGTNAEVVGAIAGVIVGAILTLIITLINS